MCGLSEAKTLAEVARALNTTSLPHLCLHLLNCLPLVGCPSAIPVPKPKPLMLSSVQSYRHDHSFRRFLVPSSWKQQAPDTERGQHASLESRLWWATDVAECLQAAPSCAETHWIFVGCLVLGRQVAAAVQVTYHGHAVGALKHYKPYISALNQADSQKVPRLLPCKPCWRTPSGPGLASRSQGRSFVQLSLTENKSQAQGSDMLLTSPVG